MKTLSSVEYYSITKKAISIGGIYSSRNMRRYLPRRCIIIKKTGLVFK